MSLETKTTQLTTTTNNNMTLTPLMGLYYSSTHAANCRPLSGFFWVPLILVRLPQGSSKLLPCIGARHSHLGPGQETQVGGLPDSHL